MTRKSTNSTSTGLSAPRNPTLEQELCRAIEHRVLVDLRYDDDLQARTFAPYVVYRTSNGKVCVFGMQIPDRAGPSDRTDPHNFEVGRIRDVSLLATRFERDPHFDLSNARYRNRVCPV
ncbi:MAG: WYL domain-containing protein [Novosphingobium sp.]|nr:WYL domain-containing protein [Novosphingobium sp.]